LGNAAQHIFDDVDGGDAELVIPLIAVAELVFAIEKHKLNMPDVIAR